MADSRVIQRYVKSLLGLAVEQGVLEAVHADMILLDGVCHQSRPFKLMLQSPIVRHDKKREIIHAVLKGKINQLSFEILDLLTRKNRESLIPAIAAYFHTAYKEYKKIGSATVTSVTELNASLEKAIIEIVKNISQQTTIDLTKKYDETLIGGFVLDIGNSRIDASIKNKLRSLKNEFAK